MGNRRHVNIAAASVLAAGCIGTLGYQAFARNIANSDRRETDGTQEIIMAGWLPSSEFGVTYSRHTGQSCYAPTYPVIQVDSPTVRYRIHTVTTSGREPKGREMIILADSSDLWTFLDLSDQNQSEQVSFYSSDIPFLDNPFWKTPLYSGIVWRGSIVGISEVDGSLAAAGGISLVFSLSRGHCIPA